MPKILLAQEDPEARESFSALILDFFPSTNLQSAASWEELGSLLAAPPPASVLLSDILWKEEERSAELLLLAERFPEISFALFGRYDLTGSLPAGYPIPLFVPDEQLPLRLSELMENLSGRGFGAYEISTPAGPHILGRLYWAKHHQLQRSVQILVPPPGSAVFSKAIRAMARVNHPSVYSLYESIPVKNRILVVLEPVIHPTLLHLRIFGQPPNLLSCARMATALGSVLAEMESSSIPARLLGEYDYTVSPKGTPRLRNPAATPGQKETSAYENARHLATILEPFLNGEPRLAPLLQILRNPGASAIDLLRQCREFEQQLAEVREVHVRKEELEAAAKTLRARMIRRWAIGLGSLFLTALIVSFPAVVRFAQREIPAKAQNQSLPVPGGPIQVDGRSVQVPPFRMDQFEITIGQYETFLQAVRKIPAAELVRLLPSGSLKTQWQELIPEGWNFGAAGFSRFQIRWDLYGSALRGGSFQGTPVSRDTPVSGIDYDSAYAYARFVGRFLPTRAQFLRAALGQNTRIYDWSRLNVGSGLQAISSKRSGFYGALPVGTTVADEGPYLHRDLAGNVSEWILAPPGERPRYVSANFAETNDLKLRIDGCFEVNRDFKAYWLGFRTVDSTPP